MTPSYFAKPADDENDPAKANGGSGQDMFQQAAGAARPPAGGAQPVGVMSNGGAGGTKFMPSYPAAPGTPRVQDTGGGDNGLPSSQPAGRMTYGAAGNPGMGMSDGGGQAWEPRRAMPQFQPPGGIGTATPTAGPVAPAGGAALAAPPAAPATTYTGQPSVVNNSGAPQTVGVPTPAPAVPPQVSPASDPAGPPRRPFQGAGFAGSGQFAARQQQLQQMQQKRNAMHPGIKTGFTI